MSPNKRGIIGQGIGEMSGKYPEKFAVIPKAKATWAHSNDASWSTDDNITLAKNPPFYRHYSDGN